MNKDIKEDTGFADVKPVIVYFILIVLFVFWKTGFSANFFFPIVPLFLFALIIQLISLYIFNKETDYSKIKLTLVTTAIGGLVVMVLSIILITGTLVFLVIIQLLGKIWQL